MTDTIPSSGPELRYRQDLQQGLIVPDVSQEHAVSLLESRYRHLAAKWQTAQARGLLQGIRQILGAGRNDYMKGLYFWGGVGRGKTYLMDMFFHALPGKRKLRMHFHRFMLMVHKRLHEAKGHSNPLVHVAGIIASDADVICFDEFFVSDIGDAMILSNLLQALFDEGVMLVATSNIVPGRLYENGLQRQLFLPAIALLQQHTEVLHMDGGVDYRLQSLDKVPVFHFPLNPQSAQAMDQLFTQLTRGLLVDKDRLLEVEGRQLRARGWAEGIVWFDFSTLCSGPRGAADYIELARQNHTVFVSDIPVLGVFRDDEARRYITMVDEFYDHGVKLVVSAATDLASLYQGQDLVLPFARTISRMQEMQTREYLALPHHPD